MPQPLELAARSYWLDKLHLQNVIDRIKLNSVRLLAAGRQCGGEGGELLELFCSTGFPGMG